MKTTNNETIPFITKEEDRKNLSFLLSSSDAVMDQWIKTATHDDLVYAQEILNSYKKEIDLIAFEKTIEKKLEMDPSYIEAKAVIEKIKTK
jgi:hypothetical protein